MSTAGLSPSSTVADDQGLFRTEPEWEHHRQKLLFGFVDQLLDGESPVCHLKDERQAAIVQNAFLHFADERYRLLAFVVMPSHHHWLFLPDEAWSVAAVARARKGVTATHASRNHLAQYPKLHGDDV